MRLGLHWPRIQAEYFNPPGLEARPTHAQSTYMYSWAEPDCPDGRSGCKPIWDLF